MVCYYIIKYLEKDGILVLGIVYDCFFVKLEKVEILKDVYKEGLVLVLVVY